MVRRKDGVDAGRHCEVGVVSFQRPRQSVLLLVDWIMPNTLKFPVDRPDNHPLPIASCLPQELEVQSACPAPGSLGYTNMREAKEIESLRSPFATCLAPFGDKPAKGDYTCLVGVEIERKHGEPPFGSRRNGAASAWCWNPTMVSSAYRTTITSPVAWRRRHAWTDRS